MKKEKVSKVKKEGASGQQRERESDVEAGGGAAATRANKYDRLALMFEGKVGDRHTKTRQKSEKGETGDEQRSKGGAVAVSGRNPIWRNCGGCPPPHL